MCRCYDSFVVISVFGDLFDFYSCGRVCTVCSSECYACGTFAFTLFAPPLNVMPGTFEQVASWKLVGGLSWDAGSCWRTLGLLLTFISASVDTSGPFVGIFSYSFGCIFVCCPCPRSICSSSWCWAFESVQVSAIVLVSCCFWGCRPEAACRSCLVCLPRPITVAGPDTCFLVYNHSVAFPGCIFCPFRFGPLFCLLQFGPLLTLSFVCEVLSCVGFGEVGIY